MGGGRRLDTGVAVAVGGPNDSSAVKPIPTNRFRQISRSHSRRTNRGTRFGASSVLHSSQPVGSRRGACGTQTTNTV